MRGRMIGRSVPAASAAALLLVGLAQAPAQAAGAAMTLSNPADSSVVTGTPVAEGTYTVTVVANGSPTATDAQAAASIVSTGSTFTVGPY